MMHNVDFHAVIGPGGGATLLNTEEGESKRGVFKLTAPGLFFYHCSVEPVGEHIGRCVSANRCCLPKNNRVI